MSHRLAVYVGSVIVAALVLLILQPINPASPFLAHYLGWIVICIVSESLWEQWCETVKRYNLGQEKLGRLSPTLQALPTVIWHSRLEEYYDRSLVPALATAAAAALDAAGADVQKP